MRPLKSILSISVALAASFSHVDGANVRRNTITANDVFLDNIVSNMTVTDLVLQLHLMFADNIIGTKSQNELYDYAMRFSPDSPVGVIHDWYPTNQSQYNVLQKLNLQKARLSVPFLHFGECLHGVGSFRQSLFPQSIGMAASFDTAFVQKVGRAIGSEARSIGIHACLSPVLDLGLDPRWGRTQEAWGEDMLLTSQMGVAMASGLSKNGSWSDPDAVVPVMKHFAAHGSPQGGINGAPSMVLGTRQVWMNMMRAFKAAVDLGGARGVLMAYSELDGIPSSVNPMLYKSLSDWGFDGFVTADDTGMAELQTGHHVASSPADAIQQWFNAGGMIQYYDYPIDVYLNATIDLVNNGTVALSTLQSHVRRILGVKNNLGLFENPYIPTDIDSDALTAAHIPLTLDAAHRSIVLLENRNNTLPLKPMEQGIKKIALIGPYGDILNYGDYAGQWGGYPVANSSTIRQAMTEYISKNCSSVDFVSSWGSNTWYYNGQYNIPPYLLSANGTIGGLLATYYADVNFTEPVFQTFEAPNRDWGLYPPNGLPSNNFSATWEGEVTVPVDSDVDGFFGVAVIANTSAKLYIDGSLVQVSEATTAGNILGNIPGLGYTTVNATKPPPGSVSFKFTKGVVHKIRVEYQAWNYNPKEANVASLNAEIELFWNLVDQTDAVGQAVALASDADVIILAVGANWNSDGEGGDRATLGLSTNQTQLADAIFALRKPVVLLLEGGRPFAIPDYYAQSAAVIDAFFPGQSGGQAISDVLFGEFNPGGRVPLSVPYDVGTLPVFYNYKGTARANSYTDITPWPSYSFGHGLSYTTFSLTSFKASSTKGNTTFGSGDIITFSVDITNNGTMTGSYVPQVYLLNRVSAITMPTIQLMAFTRTYLNAGETVTVSMELEVDRYLPILDRAWNWVLETGGYTFALLESGAHDARQYFNVTMTCV